MVGGSSKGTKRITIYSCALRFRATIHQLLGRNFSSVFAAIDRIGHFNQ